MLNKEGILAFAWEHSEGSGKRYTFTEESLFEFLKELKTEPAPAPDEREAFEGWADQQWPGAKRQQLERDEYGQYKNTIYRDYWTGWQARATLPEQTEQQHPDDAAVDRFAAAMKAKLAAARAKGRGGWDDPNVCSVEFLAQLLVEHLAKGNAGTFEDVANFAMMLHQRGAEPKVLADAAPIAQTAPDSDMRDNYLDLLQEVLDAKEVMRAAGIEQGSFGAMFKQLAKQTAQQTNKI